MKRLLLFLLPLAATACAGELPERASEAFADLQEGRSYEAESLPHRNPGAPFIRKGTHTPTVEAVADGHLTFQTDAPLETLSYQVGELLPATGESPTWWTAHATPEKGYTVELRLRALTGPYRFSFIASHANAEADDQVLSIEESATLWGREVLSHEPNDDAFHTFRLVREPGGNRYQLWRDGEQIGRDLKGSGSYENRFWFGDWGGKPGGGVLDYLRWDTTGAYRPATSP